MIAKSYDYLLITDLFQYIKGLVSLYLFNLNKQLNKYIKPRDLLCLKPCDDNGPFVVLWL